MEQNNYTELSGYSLNKIYNKNGPKTPRPQIHHLSRIFQDFLEELLKVIAFSLTKQQALSQRTNGMGGAFRSYY